MKNYFKQFAFLIIYLLGKIFPRNGMPVLFYHSMDESGSLLSISKKNFVRQMNYLKESGYDSLTSQKFLEHFENRNNKSFPGKKFLVTFDDGYKNNIEAIDILKELNFSAVIFVTTGYIGGYNDFCERDVPKLPMLAMEEIRNLSKSGAEFGAHGHTHRNITDLTNDEALSDISKSKQILENELGSKVISFCYPRGKYASNSEKILKNLGFKIAFTSKTGIVSPKSSPYFLPRVPINDKVSDLQFKALLSPWYGFFMSLRGGRAWRGRRRNL